MQTERLTRSRTDRTVAGVCAGLAHYFNIDVVLVRIGFVVLTLVGVGATIPLYLALWVIVPEDGAQLDTRSTVQANLSEMRQQAEVLLDKTGLRTKKAEWKFDPHTGQPLNPPAPAVEQPRFDPYTGQPLDR